MKKLLKKVFLKKFYAIALTSSFLISHAQSAENNHQEESRSSQQQQLLQQQAQLAQLRQQQLLQQHVQLQLQSQAQFVQLPQWQQQQQALQLTQQHQQQFILQQQLPQFVSYPHPVTNQQPQGANPQLCPHGVNSMVQENRIVSTNKRPYPGDVPGVQNKRQRLIDSPTLAIMSQGKTLQCLMDEARMAENLNNSGFETQELVFVKIYNEFGLEAEEVDEDKNTWESRGRSQNLNCLFIEILSHHSKKVNQFIVSNYDDLELFGLCIMYNSIEIKSGSKGAPKLREHKERVMAELKKRAGVNNPIALCCLGEIEKNYQYFVKATELGDKRAQIQLANISFKDAMQHINKGNFYFYDDQSLAWMSDTPGFHVVSLREWSSLNPDPNADSQEIKKGWEIMKDLADQGHHNASYYMGKFYEHFGNFPKAFRYYKQSAHQNNAKSKTRLEDHNFKKNYDLSQKALGGPSAKEILKAQRRLGKLYFPSGKSYEIDVGRIPKIAAYWWNLNALQCPKNYYLIAKYIHHLKNREEQFNSYLKAAESGDYKSQYILGKAFSEKEDLNHKETAIKYLTFSFITVMKKLDRSPDEGGFREIGHIREVTNRYLYNKRKGRVDIFEDLREILNIYFDINIDKFYRHTRIFDHKNQLPKDLPENQREEIELVKEYPPSMESFIAAHVSFFAKCGGRYEDSLKGDPYIISTTTHIITLGEKMHSLILKINTGINEPGFCITSMAPKEDWILNLLESDPGIFPVKKTPWLFYLQRLQNELAEIQELPGLLEVQKKMNDAAFNIINDSELYPKLFNEQDRLLILKVSGCCSPDRSFEKYLNSIMPCILDAPEKRIEILDFLKERKDYLENHISFIPEALKTISKIIEETEDYRNGLFQKANFLNPDRTS